MAPGRNDPCPCGSGKKHKACCLKAARSLPDETLWRRLNDADARLARTLLAHFGSALAPEAKDKAFAEFYGPYGEDGLPERDAPMFFPWLFSSWTPPKRLWLEASAHVTGRHTVGADLLARHPSRLDDLSRRYLEASLAEPFSVYEVLSAEPGSSLDLRDLFRERAFHVSERTASKTVRAHDVVFAHLVTLDGLTTLSGTAPIVLEPSAKIVFIDLAARMKKAHGALTTEVLFREAKAVRLAFLGIVDRRLNPRMPDLRNTDGEPLAPHRLRFIVEDPDAAFEALRSLDPSRSRAEALAEATRGSGGRLKRATIEWLRPGAEGSTGHLQLGHLTLDGRNLVVEVNSTERARRIRMEIEERLGTGVTFVSDVVTSVERALDRTRPTGKDRREEKELLADPEVRAKVEEMARDHYARWLDEPVPALGGKTPREAARSKTGRAKLEALLEDFERRSGPNPFAPPVAQLRRELGLDGGGGKS